MKSEAVRSCSDWLVLLYAAVAPLQGSVLDLWHIFCGVVSSLWLDELFELWEVVVLVADVEELTVGTLTEAVILWWWSADDDDNEAEVQWWPLVLSVRLHVSVGEVVELISGALNNLITTASTYMKKCCVKLHNHILFKMYRTLPTCDEIWLDSRYSSIHTFHGKGGG